MFSTASSPDAQRRQATEAVDAAALDERTYAPRSRWSKRDGLVGA